MTFPNLKSKKVLTEGNFKAKVLDYTAGTYENTGKSYGILSLDINEIGKHNFLLGEQTFTDYVKGTTRTITPIDRMSSLNNYLATQLGLANDTNAFEHAFNNDIEFEIKVIEKEYEGKIYHNLQIPARASEISEETIVNAFTGVEYIE